MDSPVMSGLRVVEFLGILYAFKSPAFWLGIRKWKRAYRDKPHSAASLMYLKNIHMWDFPGPVVKNAPSNGGDAGSTSGRGPTIPYAQGQLSPRDL